MKALIILILFVAIFGTAAYFAYDIFFAPKQLLKEEVAQGAPPPPPDPSLADFEKCVQLKKEGKPAEAQKALETFIDENPRSTKVDDARDALGEVNIELFFSKTPSPEKEQYVVQRGDTLSKIHRKLKTTPEQIMKQNNLSDPTKLQIGQVFIVAHPEFSVVISRKEQKVILLNRQKFFKQYKVKTWNAPAPKNPKKIAAPMSGKVVELIAWKSGQRVAFGTREYAGSSRWVSVSVPGFTLYTDPEEGGEKAPAGLALTAAQMEELSTLLARGVPVRIE